MITQVVRKDMIQTKSNLLRKNISRMLNALCSLLFLFFVASCSSSSDEVTIEGRFLHMNQATFYVYSTDGAISGIDTIQVRGGRFEYDRMMSGEGTLVIIFPNYSQMPVFVEPGASITIKGDAANLKQLEIKGTDANDDMTEWRENNVGMSPIEQKKHAELFIKDNPESMVSLWLIRQYYVTTPKPDLKTATSLLKDIIAQEPDNVNAKRMLTDVSSVGTVSIGDRLSAFSVKDINGNTVTEKTLQKGKCMVLTCASWNMDSQNMVRRLVYSKRYGSESKENGVDKVMVLCLEADNRECRRVMNSCDAQDFIFVNDTTQWDSKLLKVFGFTRIPDNIVLKDGKVIKRRVPTEKL